jgi:two-component system OmpR family sensor kinase
MKTRSIFFKLNLLFATALIVTLVAGALLYRHLQGREHLSLMLKSRVVLQELRRNHTLSEELLKSLDLERVPAEEAARLLQRGQLLPHPPHRRPGWLYSRGMLHYGGRVYLLLRSPKGTLLLRSRHNPMQFYLFPGLVFLAILLLLGFSYWTLRRTLNPLRRLEEDIRRYGRGEALRDRELFAHKEDEIARVGRAFYDSAERLRRYGEARRLFLRNLLHELNTPVTKGKLLAELSEEPRTRRMLGSIFERLSTLLKELVEVERVAAGSEPFETRENIGVRETLAEACRRLYCEAVPMEVPEETTLFADREAMIIVFKNLLDNALKYGSNPRITLKGKELLFLSEGRPLKHPIEHYTEPFRQEYGAEKREGFGLGLYIVREILERHGMELSYRHEAGENLFGIGPIRDRGIQQ